MSRPSPDTQTILEALRSAVADALDKKRRLGQYAVIWKDDRLQIIQPPASPPASLLEAESDSYAPRKTQD